MKTNKFISPFISCVVQNFPFIEESIDGLTQYELLCKIVEKLNAVITQTNTQTENIEKLEEAFTTLKNYVDNYFNNLDIQTEIDNKLNEMATSGELEAIIASYLNTQAVRGFSTLNDLKNATGLISGAICQTSGKNTYKDGLGSLYRIRNITNKDTIDNDNLVAITSDVSLVAEKITNNISNAKTTGTTNTYSCDYVNKITEKNILSAYNASVGEEVSAFGTTTIALDTVISSIGTKLTLSNGSVKIGSGVSKVMVSGVLRGYFKNNNSTTNYEVGCRINKNTTIARALEFIIDKNTTINAKLITVAPFLLDVEENDVISIGIYSSSGNAVRKYLENSYLTIEVIE